MARDDGTSLLTPELIVAEKVIAQDGARSLAKAEHGGLSIEVKFTSDALWVIFCRDGSGGLALRFRYSGATPWPAFVRPMGR